MNPTLNLLLQLQQLVLIRDEQAVTARATDLNELDSSIAAMFMQLPPNEKASFEKLKKKNHVVMVPISDGVCAGCGMALPISLIQAVRHAQAIQHCPSCARMLYWQESPPRRLGKTIKRSFSDKVGVARFSCESLMIPELSSTDKAGAIREMADVMEKSGFIDNGDRFTRAALQRETIFSTAVDHGMAFPHVRGVEGGGLALSLGVSRKGIVFDKSRKQLTRLVFIVSIPTAASAFYLKLLSGLTQTFRSADARKRLMQQKDQAGMWNTLVKLTRSTIT